MTNPSEVWTELTHVRRVESAEGIPDGEFSGTWSGNVVTFRTEFGEYVAISKWMLRGHDAECTVVVRSGKFQVIRKC